MGRLINVVDRPLWSDKRDAAWINVMARAGLRVSEALALKIGGGELGPRSGTGERGQGAEGEKRALSNPSGGLHTRIAATPLIPASSHATECMG